MVRLAGTVARLPKYVSLGRALLSDGSVSGPRRTAILLGLGYAISPVDLIPGVIPVVGQLDDLAALLLTLRTALRGCSSDAAEAHLQRAGLSGSALDADIRTVAVAGVWIVATVASAGARAIRGPMRWLGNAARAVRRRPAD